MHSREELEEMQRLPLQRKIQITTARIIEWYQHYDGKVYVAFSGGKDSTVLLDIVRRIYPDVPAVFSDTGLEFPEVREFVKSCENVTIVRPEMNFRKVIEVYGYPVVSKRVANTVEYGHKPGSFRWKELHGEIMRSNGTPSEFNCEKWCYLLDAPFKVSSRCCTVMKKRPMRNHKVYNHWLPLFTVLLGTGCRIGEAIGLRWEDCDFDEGIISINHNMVYRKYEEDEKARFHIVTPKTSAGVRIVPMLSEVKAALQAEWETQKIVGFNESVVDGYTGFIFQNRYGDPLSPHSVNRAIDRICAAYIEDETVLADQEGRDPVLIRHFSAHNLRHTFCTRFCENERNIKVIQEIMGHADIETTMNIYAEATKEKKKESFSNLEGKIKIS